MRRRKLFILTGAALAAVAVGAPLGAALAQDATPTAAWPWPSHPMMGARGNGMGMHGTGMGMGSGAGMGFGMRGGPGSQGTGADMGRHFIEEMIPHHEDAISMADLALTRAEHQEVRDLAAAIKQTQAAEITQMRQWYRDWFGSEPGPSRMTQMPNMPGHDLSALAASPTFDKTFIEGMVPHHQMAVMMTSHMASRVEQPELKALMQAMGTSQAAEIGQMSGWYQNWYGVALPAPAFGPRAGMGMGPGAGQTPGQGPPAGMGPGMHPGMGPGMGAGMGPGMGAGMGMHHGMHGGAGPMGADGQPPCLPPSGP